MSRWLSTGAGASFSLAMAHGRGREVMLATDRSQWKRKDEADVGAPLLQQGNVGDRLSRVNDGPVWTND